MKIFNNSKLCTQILCFLLFMMLLNLGILLGCLNINLYFFKEMILDSSQSILNRQLNQEIKAFSYFSKLMIERYQFREIRRIESINRLYQFTWDESINLIDSEQCLNKKFSSYSGMCSMCYGIMNSKVNLNKTNFSKYIKITNLFSLTFLMADNSFDLVFAGTTKEKFIALWPQQGIVTFDPQTRPWFLVGQNQGNNNSKLYETYFTKPYIHTKFKSVTISHTQSLYDKDFSRIGVVSIQLNFSSTFPEFLQNNQRIKGYILDQNYNILQGNIPYSTINTFFDQNITGFNQSNLIILQTYLNQGQILQNCQKLNDKLLCLQDIYQQEFIIEAYKLRENNQFFILVLNPYDDLKLLEKRTETLNQQIAELMQTIFIQTLMPYFTASILMFIVIFHITNKISKIIYKAQSVIFKNSASAFKLLSLQVFQAEKHGSLNCLENLEISFAKLNNKLNLHQKQNLQCIQISNSCEYIQRDFFHQISLKKSINTLQNQDYCLPGYQIRKIMNHQKYNYLNLP